MRFILILCAGLLFLAVADLPIGYYTLLRLAVTVGGVMVIVREYKGQMTPWIIAFGLVVIVFNPLIPIYLHDKSLWMAIDVVCGTLFFVKAITVKSQKAS